MKNFSFVVFAWGHTQKLQLQVSRKISYFAKVNSLFLNGDKMNTCNRILASGKIFITRGHKVK